MLPKLPFANSEVLLGGLPTPPVDDMSTTYQPTVASTYDNHAVHAYSASLAHAARNQAVRVEANQTQYARQPNVQQALVSNHQRLSSVPVASQQLAPSRQPVRLMTPGSEVAMTQKEKSSGRGSSDALIYHSLQIPRCISSNGGNLADFAAQVR